MLALSFARLRPRRHALGPPLSPTIRLLGAGLLCSLLLTAPRGEARTASLPETKNPAQAIDDSRPPDLAAAKQALADGRLEEAYVLAVVALEFSPEDPERLQLAADVAEAENRLDEAIWYLREALALEDLPAARRTDLQRKLDLMDPRPGEMGAAIDAYAGELFELARSLERRRFYANAVDLLLRCQGTAVADQAQRLLDRIYGNQRAVDELLASGVEVPVQPPRARQSAAAIAREDARRSDWRNAYEIRSTNYTIRTNMGQDMANAMSKAMEEMNKFYRQVFRYSERGATMRRCNINVFATRADFDAVEGPLSPSIRGFFVPLQNRVAVYDRRTDGGTLGDLWSTLFHEASHQFTHAASRGLLIPGWLNEGTASYFEGARLMPNGRVETNLIPDNRLRPLFRDLGFAPGDTEPSRRPGVRVRDVIAYYQPGSYDGRYYPFGWGLVYFIHNFEDERSERVYLKAYADYWDSYRSGGGQHDVVDRFIEHFVRRARVPGVTTFEDFEQLFTRWIGELYRIHFGGPEQADTLLARGAKQMANGKAEYAEDSYRWALRKRAGDLGGYYGLGLALQAQRRNDAALHAFRMALETVRTIADTSQTVKGFEAMTVEALAEDATRRMTSIESNLGPASLASGARFEERVLALADGYVEDGYPRAALGLLRSSERLLGRTAAMVARETQIRRADGLDVRRWRRLNVDGELSDWERGWGQWEAADWVIRAQNKSSSGYLIHADALGSRFRYEFDFTIEDGGEGGGLLGLVFGYTPGGGQRMLCLIGGRNLAFATIDPEEGLVLEGQPIGQLRPEIGETVRLGIEAHGDRVEVFVDGSSRGSRPISGVDLAGQVGLLASGINVRFSRLRVLR